MDQLVSFLRGISLPFLVLVFCAVASQAQPKKGDKEVFLLTSSTFIGLGDTGGDVFINGSGKLGYYLSRHNEVGGGISFYIDRFRACATEIDQDGQIIDQQCTTGVNKGVGLNAFYRYNFSRKETHGFPFIGMEFSVADVTTNYTGNTRIRPNVGYKYFVKKNIGLDFSFGYSVDLLKVNLGSQSGGSIFNTNRQSNLDGQLGLTFVF